MTPHWKLTVEGLGKIEHAEVDIRPLTLFVGPNNTGKSYVASLIWGVVAMQGELEPPEGPELEACRAWVAQHIVEGATPVQVAMHRADIELFERLFRVMLEKNRAVLIQRIFKSEQITARRIAWENEACPSEMAFAWSTDRDDPEKHVLTLTDGPGTTSIKTHPQTNDIRELRAAALDMLVRRIVFYRLTRLFRRFDGPYSRIDPVYLLASRTGFMQLYKAVARRSLERWHQDDVDNRLELTAPSFHFIDMMAFGLRSRVGRRDFGEEADWLERALMGRVELVSGNSAVNEYWYYPAGISKPLPMNLSSTLVTELTPVIAVLRYASSLPLFVYEEPEAHLHPELQRLVAQVIVRLVRKGLFVVVTTHSPDFCQQINNFIKLGSLAADKRAEAQAKLGYGPQVYLEQDDVSGYEFKSDDAGTRTSVVEMKKRPSGLVMPTFNASLASLSDEIFELTELLSEHEVVS
ncbi:MAG: ATP-binding protein [Polyangiaceae bacterium]|nr:ATP-binding protein [Polyangiaceae bacterium]